MFSRIKRINAAQMIALAATAGMLFIAADLILPWPLDAIFGLVVLYFFWTYEA